MTSDDRVPVEQIRELAERLPPTDRAALVRALGGTPSAVSASHPFARRLMATPDELFAAVARAGDFTVRMIRGVIAEYFFEQEVVRTLAPPWRSIALDGEKPYDFLLTDSPEPGDLEVPVPNTHTTGTSDRGPVRVQVKMQRSRKPKPGRARTRGRSHVSVPDARALLLDLGIEPVLPSTRTDVVPLMGNTRGDAGPLPAHEQWTRLVQWPADYYVAELQKSRRGEKGGQPTRPLSFGEFDILAVSLGPARGRWGAFMYTLDRWLLRDPTESGIMLKYQPVAPERSAGWTPDFLECVSWLRDREHREGRPDSEPAGPDRDAYQRHKDAHAKPRATAAAIGAPDDDGEVTTSEPTPPRRPAAGLHASPAATEPRPSAAQGTPGQLPLFGA